MKRLINIVICLCVAASIFAVTYQPCTPSYFRSTSVYVTGATDYNQSSYTIHHTLYTSKATGSMTAISASNFAALNDEGGEFYQPSATRSAVRKVTRPDGDDDDDLAIGEINEHSPIGDTPWIVFGLLAIGYAVYVGCKKRKNAV